MRQGQQNKRMRGRNRKGPNPLTRSFESNGPDVKIRGTALHIAEKYVQLARDAQVSGDRVRGESYLQHAEHFYRIVAAAQAQLQQMQPQQQFHPRGEDGDDARDNRGNGYGTRPDGQPAFGLSDPQPYVNGSNGPDDQSDDDDDAGPGTNEVRTEARDQPDHGGYRGRRRRPYRERPGQAGDGGDGSDTRAAPEAADAPQGDD
jgi:hypothetical protein